MDGEDDGLDRLPFDIIIEKVHGQKGFTQEFDKKRGEPGREGRCAKRRGRDVSDDFVFPIYLDAVARRTDVDIIPTRREPVAEYITKPRPLGVRRGWILIRNI